MNVVFFYQHYWPDSPPYASMLRTISESLQVKGIDVHVLTGRPSYKPTDRQTIVQSSDMVNGVSVQRLYSLWGIERFRIVLLLQKILFPLRALIALVVRRFLLRKKIDVIVAATIPPVLNGGFAWLAARLVGAKFIYHLQDVYPEIGTTSGIWKDDSWVARTLKSLDTFICKRADSCVVLSDDMRISLLKRGIDKDTIVVINNFLLESHKDTLTSGVNHIPLENDSVNIVFAGNLGRFQGLNHVLDGFLHWQKAQSNEAHKKMVLHFLGEGSEKTRLLAKADGNNKVMFHDHLPFSEAAEFIRICDAGIVSLNRGVYQYAFPSKILTYLGLGTPLFALVEAESEIARELQSSKLGVVCGSRSPEQVAAALEELRQLILNGDFEKSRISNYYQANLDGDVALQKWNALINSVSSTLSADVKAL